MKYLKILLVTLAFICIAPSAFAEVSVCIDDKEVVFSDQSPVIIDNRTYVPMRKIFEDLGATVDWISDTHTVFASKRFDTISLAIGEEVYYINGVSYPLENPAMIINGRTMVPVRVVAESFGAEVIWDKDNYRVLIYNNDGDYPVSDKYIDFSEKAEDGFVILTGRTAYPQIKSDDEISRAFNEFFLGEAEEISGSKRITYKEYALSGYDEFKENFIPYMAERSFDVAYNSNGIISLLFADSDFLGGFHPSYQMFGVTYNMKNGHKIECWDILNDDIYTIRENVYNKFLSLIDSNPEEYFFDAKDCLGDALTDLKWYLTDDGVHFFLNPYEIAPYARGIVEVIY